MLDGENITAARKQRSIDLTPMIDAIFILLIFFMVSTTFSKSGIKINLPKTQNTTQIITKKPPLEIYINAKGKYFYEKRNYTIAELKKIVSTKKSTYQNDLFIVINPDKNSKTQDLLRALDLCKSLDITNFSIATQKE